MGVLRHPNPNQCHYSCTPLFLNQLIGISRYLELMPVPFGFVLPFFESFYFVYFEFGFFVFLVCTAMTSHANQEYPAF